MKARTLVLTGIVVAAALARVLPHPANFSPAGALALFAAARFRSRLAGLVVPLLALLLGDLGLEAAHRLGLLGGWMAGGAGLYRGMWVVYLAVGLVACLGLLLRRWHSAPAIACCTVAGSTVFFLVTNFAWWGVYDLYPHTWAGLLLCYDAALPFFAPTLLGDAFFATALFGGFALAERYYPALRREPLPG
jgi:hypothetical protein